MRDLFDDVLICVDCGLSAEELDPRLTAIGGRFLSTGAWVCSVCRLKRDMAAAGPKAEGES